MPEAKRRAPKNMITNPMVTHKEELVTPDSGILYGITRDSVLKAAAGLLSTDTRFEYRSTLWQSIDDADMQRIDSVYDRLREQALAQLASSGFSAEDSELTFVAECRYQGQGYELPVEVPPPPANDAWLASVRDAFHAAHEQAYLRRFDDKPVMIVNVGIVGIGKVPPLTLPTSESGGEEPDASALLATADIHFIEANRAAPHTTRFIDRRRLAAGNVIEGPAIFEQSDTTTVLPPGWRAQVDHWGNLIVEQSGEKDG